MYFFLKFEKGVNYISFVFRTNRCGVKAISEFATHITEYGNIEVFAIASERLEGEIMECINYVYFFGGKCYGIHEFGYNSIANIEEYSSKMVEILSGQSPSPIL